jgi:hypothetical protein
MIASRGGQPTLQVNGAIGTIIEQWLLNKKPLARAVDIRMTIRLVVDLGSRGVSRATAHLQEGGTNEHAAEYESERN